MKHKAVFLDKDGTLIPDIPYNADPSLISLLPGVGEGLKALQAAGYRLVVVSNQSGVALGRFTEADLVYVWQRLRGLLAADGISRVSFYYCPHAAEGTVFPYAHLCSCRKPLPGLLLRAATDLEISLSESWMVGDILNDVEAGKRAGCKTILADNGNETEWILNEWRRPDYILHDIRSAADMILLQNEKEYATAAAL
jgi:histidinol-phosphate phosphatase family protein